MMSSPESRYRGERVSLFVDFDGTLVPIEANPTSPRLDSGNRGSPPGVTESILPLKSAADSPRFVVLTLPPSGHILAKRLSRIGRSNRLVG